MTSRSLRPVNPLKSGYKTHQQNSQVGKQGSGQAKNSNLNPISIVSWNAHSLNDVNKQLYIQSLPQSILCIQETWGANEFPVQSLVNNVNIHYRGRENSRGGGTVTILKSGFRVLQEYRVNKDTSLAKLEVHGNKILWLCNCYLNQGRTSQIQKLFKVIKNCIPGCQFNRTIIIGDLNVNSIEKTSEKFRLLNQLSRELGMRILEPDCPTFKDAKLDLAIIPKDMEANLVTAKGNLSDHSPIVLEIKLNTFNKDKTKIWLPNRELAVRNTLNALKESDSISEFLRNFDQSLVTNGNRVMKSLKKHEYERNLFNKLTQSKDIDVKQVINQYWKDLLLENENRRFSNDCSKAFEELQRIFGYKNFELRDGSIANCVKVDGVIVTEPYEVNLKVMDALKLLQYNDQFPETNLTEFPNMPPLSDQDASEIIDAMSSGKALAYDLFSDIIFNGANKDKFKGMIKNLWTEENLSKLDSRHFLARLIPLNKKHPDVPTPQEIRPIIVMSPLYKLLEARLLPKLRNYLISKLARSQIGFVSSMDVSVNIQRALEQVKKRTNAGSRAFCLFLDFKSAYNTVPHQKLFQKLETILSEEELQLLKALYSRLTIKLGQEELKANTGVAQSSMISPALFDIYAESILKKLIGEGWSLEDLLAFANDHLVKSKNLEQLKPGSKSGGEFWR